jgi:WD40 repeat protein
MIVLQGTEERVNHLQFSPDARTLIAPFRRGVQLWQGLAGGTATKVLWLPGVSWARFAPDGQRVLLGGLIVVIDDLSSSEVTRVPLELPTGPVYCDLSPDGRILVAAQVPLPPQKWRARSMPGWKCKAGSTAEDLPTRVAPSGPSARMAA